MAMIQELWLEYYPIVLTALGVAMTFIAGALVIWSQLKPVLEKLNLVWEKIKGTDKDDVTNLLQQNDMATKITDLKAKLANPTLSDELKQEYMVQLETALELKAKLDAGLVKVEEVTNKFL